jgi:hypothetical protein
MNSHIRKFALRTIVLTSCALPIVVGLLVPAGRAQEALEINGEKVVTLKRAAGSNTKPVFTSVTVAPGRGMEVLQITANFPGKGEVNVLNSPDLPTIKDMLDLTGTAAIVLELPFWSHMRTVFVARFLQTAKP